VAKAALVLSIAALLFAAWSAWSAHRSARSSENSARSAAEALELERERRHAERIPRLRLLYDHRVGNSEGLWLVNDGPDSYQVRVTLIPREDGGPVQALQVPKSSGGVTVVREGDEGDLERPMVVGDKRVLRLGRTPGLRSGIVRLRFTCSNEHGEWITAAECEIPGRVPHVQVRRSGGHTDRA
jgi:hypothetical protein